MKSIYTTELTNFIAVPLELALEPCGRFPGHLLLLSGQSAVFARIFHLKKNRLCAELYPCGSFAVWISITWEWQGGVTQRDCIAKQRYDIALTRQAPAMTAIFVLFLAQMNQKLWIASWQKLTTDVKTLIDKRRSI